MNLNDLINRNPEGFSKLCQSHHVDKLYAFGSSITDHFDQAKSDIDILVNLTIEDPIEYGGVLLNLWDNLESFFGKKVDLLTDESIHNPYLRKTIEETKRLIYDGQREKIFV
jgi:uncharacterized protein